MKNLLREMDSSLSGYMPPVTRGLFYSLFLCYVLISLLEIIGQGTPFVLEITGRIFELTPNQAIFQGHVWQFLLHPLNSGGALPLLFYMLTLFFLGGLVENRMGGRRMLWFVVLSAVLTGIVHTAWALAVGLGNFPLLGMGPVDLAMFTVITLWYPRVTIRFMFLIPLQIRVVALVTGILIALDVLSAMSRLGVAAGIAGSIALLSSVPIAIWLVKFPRVLDFFDDTHFPFTRRRPKKVARMSMGHPGRHSDPDDLYNDPHWKLDQ